MRGRGGGEGLKERVEGTRGGTGTLVGCMEREGLRECSSVINNFLLGCVSYFGFVN